MARHTVEVEHSGPEICETCAVWLEMSKTHSFRAINVPDICSLHGKNVGYSARSVG